MRRRFRVELPSQPTHTTEAMSIPKKCPHCGAARQHMLSEEKKGKGYYMDYGALYACGAVLSIKCQKRQKRKAKK